MWIDEALYRGITRGVSPKTEATSVTAMIAALLRHTKGNVSQAAAYLGVPRRTLRNWQTGTKPKATGLGALRRAQRRMRLSAGREAWLRRSHVVVLGLYRVSRDIREKPILVTGWPDNPNRPPLGRVAGMQGRVVDAWLAGDDAAAVAALLTPIQTGINDQAGRNVDQVLIDTSWVRFYRSRGEALAGTRDR